MFPSPEGREVRPEGEPMDLEDNRGYHTGTGGPLAFLIHGALKVLWQTA